MIYDTDFLTKCSKRLPKEIFTSKLRQNLVQSLYSFHEVIGVAPGEDNFQDMIDFASTSLLINKKNESLYIGFFEKLKSKKLPNKRVLQHNLSNFVKIMAARKAQLELSDELERKTLRPDKLLEILKDSSEMALEFSDFPLETLFNFSHKNERREIASFFNIPLIDNCLRGGVRRPTFTVILGFTGTGKTFLTVHLGKMGARLGNNVLHYSSGESIIKREIFLPVLSS